MSLPRRRQESGSTAPDIVWLLCGKLGIGVEWQADRDLASVREPRNRRWLVRARNPYDRFNPDGVGKVRTSLSEPCRRHTAPEITAT